MQQRIRADREIQVLGFRSIDRATLEVTMQAGCRIRHRPDRRCFPG